MPRGPFEYPTISPLLLIAVASLDVSSGSVPRSRKLPLFVHRMARSPAALADVPATSSESLMSHARLSLRPGRTPRLCTPVLRVHRKAFLPFGPEEYPTTWPYLLMPNAWPQLSPGSSGIRRRSPVGVQINGTIDLATLAAPATSPASFIPAAELYSPPARLPK